jgi:hypothetical protein
MDQTLHRLIIGSVVAYLKDAVPSKIHPDLKINPNEMKIIFERALCYHNLNNWMFSDGRLCRNVSIKDAFGFYLLIPKSASARRRDYFQTVVIFTPNPGLFDENVPV